MKSMKELFEIFTIIEDEPCKCSEDQQTGIDPTVCKSCWSAGVLNRIVGILNVEYYYLKNVANCKAKQK